MPVIPETGLDSIIGAYDPYDCVWRCLAYAASSGSYYDRDAAYYMAETYYCVNGLSFDPNNYTFNGTGNQLNNFISEYIHSGDYCSTQMLIFDPSKTSTWSGNSGTLHAIIITGFSNGTYSYLDPQSGLNGTISQKEYDDSKKFNIYI